MRISDWSSDVCSSDLRFFGAGVIGVAAVWTLVKIAGPVIGGIRSAMAASRAREHGDTLALEERDLPIGIVFGGSLFMMLPIGWLLWTVLQGGTLTGSAAILIAGALLFVLVRSEEHTSELQSLMRTAFAVFCLK